MGALSAVQYTMQAQPSHVCGGPGICVCVWACHHYTNHRLTQATGMCPNWGQASVCVCVCVQWTPEKQNKASTTTDSHSHVPTRHLTTIAHIQTHLHMYTHIHTPIFGWISGCVRFGVTAHLPMQWYPDIWCCHTTRMNQLSHWHAFSCYCTLSITGNK